MRITNGSRDYYRSTVFLDGKEIVDCIFADEERGEVLVVTVGAERDVLGYRRERKELKKGTVRVVLP